jgi:hypothetical protein
MKVTNMMKKMKTMMKLMEMPVMKMETTRTELVQLQNLFAIVSLQTTMRVSPCCLLFYSSPKIPWLMLLVRIILQLQATSS